MERTISFMNGEVHLVTIQEHLLRHMWMLTEQKIISLLCMKI